MSERIHRWISEVLGSVQQDGSYGMILKFRRGPVGQVCVAFGFPDPEKFKKHGEVPDSMPLLVRKDWIVNLGDSAWRDRVTSTKLEKIHLQDASLGLKGDMSEAGSFGGWFRGTNLGPVGAINRRVTFFADFTKEKDGIYGMICRHCLPDAQIGSLVVAPSTLEVTTVFGSNAPYSTLSPERRFFRSTRNDVAHSLINEYEVETVAHEGVTVMAGDVTKQILLSGGELGKVAGGVFRHDFQYLEEHNWQLQRAGKPMFCLPPSVGPTALD